MNAQEIISIIREENQDIGLQEILDVLEDGDALAAIGCEDSDQEPVEEAHAIIRAEMEAATTNIRAEMAAATTDLEEHTVSKAFALADRIFETGEDGHSYTPYNDFRDQIDQIKTYAEAVGFARSFIEDTFDSAVDGKVEAGLLSEEDAAFITLHARIIKMSGAATLGVEVFDEIEAK